MKGINHFLTSLLPSSIESGRIKFGKTEIESSLKREDGQVIVQSNLKTKGSFNEEVCIPHLAQLQKVYRTLKDPTISVQYEQDLPAKLTLLGSGSRISLFLVDKDFVAWPELTTEPEFAVCVELPATTIESLKMNYSLVDGELTSIELQNSQVMFKVGNEAHENAASTTMDIDVADELQMTIRSEFIVSILDSITADSVVTLNLSEHGLTKITVELSTDDYSLKTNYYLIASQ